MVIFSRGPTKLLLQVDYQQFYFLSREDKDIVLSK